MKLTDVITLVIMAWIVYWAAKNIIIPHLKYENEKRKYELLEEAERMEKLREKWKR
jgi:hypothetical protein